MIFAWTKQFLLATGIFALVLTGQTINSAWQEKHLSQQQLDDASRTAHLSQAPQYQMN